MHVRPWHSLWKLWNYALFSFRRVPVISKLAPVCRPTLFWNTLNQCSSVRDRECFAPKQRVGNSYYCFYIMNIMIFNRKMELRTKFQYAWFLLKLNPLWHSYFSLLHVTLLYLLNFLYLIFLFLLILLYFYFPYFTLLPLLQTIRRSSVHTRSLSFGRV
jgi:hypothetical protein